MNRDMTKGSPMKTIVGFTVPIFIGNVFQQFYSMVDTVVVGQFVGTGALAAVGSTGTIMFLILGFLLGFSTGVTVLTGQRFGAGDLAGMRKTVASSVVLSAIVSIVMTAVSMLCMHRLLILMNTPENVFYDAYSYITIICGGIVAQVAYNLLACLLRALGNSRVPLYFLILAAVLNVVLDLVFIIVFHMGTAGAAWATVISQGVSALLCFVYIVRCVPELWLKKEDWKFPLQMVRTQIGVGLPMAFQFSITAIGTIMVQSSLNVLGAMSMAAFTAANKIEQVVTQAYTALGTTMATYCAQNTGAGRIDRIRSGFRAATIVGFVYAVVMGAAIVTGGKYLTYLFVSTDAAAIIGDVQTYLWCVGVFFIPLTVVNVYRNGLQGMGYGMLPMTAGIAELVGRGVVALIAAQFHSYLGVCLANPAAWILAGGLLIVMYFIVIHEQERRHARYASTATQEGV